MNLQVISPSDMTQKRRRLLLIEITIILSSMHFSTFPGKLREHSATIFVIVIPLLKDFFYFDPFIL